MHRLGPSSPHLCQHEALTEELLRADLPAAILAMTTDPDKDTAFSALLSLAFMLGGDDDKNNPHIVAASAAVPLLCEQLRHGGQFFMSTGLDSLRFKEWAGGRCVRYGRMDGRSIGLAFL